MAALESKTEKKKMKKMRLDLLDNGLEREGLV